MSRIGRKPIVIPAGVEVKVDAAEHAITVKGPKGTLHSKFHPLMTVAVEGNEILVTRPNDEKEARSLHGLTRTLIHNMVVGVTEGFRKDLEIQGVGYRAAKQGSKQYHGQDGRDYCLDSRFHFVSFSCYFFFLFVSGGFVQFSGISFSAPEATNSP